MSNTTTGGPAFPTTVYTNDDFKGMTLRQYAAIKLRVPNSGTEWLDEMIVQSLRDEFSAKAMQANIMTSMAAVTRHLAGNADSTMLLIAGASYEMADAMLKARESA